MDGRQDMQMRVLLAESDLPNEPDRPEPSAVLWRYMNFEKYVAMLMDSGVYFSRPSELGDDYEGSVPRMTVERLRDRLHYGQADQAAEKEARSQQAFTRNAFVVSCWHEMEQESDAMWRLYAGRGAGIAIKTDFESLLTAGLGIDIDSDTYQTGRVEYVDYDKCDIPMLFGMPLFYKRESFAYEHEVRIIRFKEDSDSNTGETFGADLRGFIHEIVLSPNAEDWMYNVVKMTTRQFNNLLAGKVRKSKISKPMYLEDL